MKEWRIQSVFHAVSAGIVLLASVLMAPGVVGAQQETRQVNQAHYADRLRAMWLGETLANWTGLTTEAARIDAPFYTDADWGRDQNIAWKQYDVIDFVFQDPWLADDDTDIEYVYLHLLTQHSTNLLTPEQIAEGWRQHINDWIWVSNRQARDLMELGALPPVTSLGANNPYGLQIDAQLTTEIFGALAPGLPAQALRTANLPILTTASGYAAHAAQFNVLLYSLVTNVDSSLSRRDQIIWLVQEARRFIPDTSKTAGIVDFVLSDYLENPDPDDWERTRDRVYERYHHNAEDNGFVFRSWTESSVNFAAGLIALLYGEGDYRRTVQIGALSGWDSDNGTATMGGLLGLLLGYDELVAQFPDEAISDRYQITRTRENLPDYLPDDRRAEDTFTLMAGRMLPIITLNVLEAGGGATDGAWLLPTGTDDDPLRLNPLAQLTARSANNRILAEGGAIEVIVGGDPAIGRTRVVADGTELNYTGIESARPPRAYQARAREGRVSITVMYDRPVEASIVRFVEGNPGRFEAFLLELLVGGEWQSAPEQTVLSAIPDPLTPYQSFDFTLPEPMLIAGVRFTVEAEVGPFGDVGVLEIDVLSE